ncbi:hypothetical protein H1R20_g13654, partial [Candolleomyces eurysporus]
MPRTRAAKKARRDVDSGADSTLTAISQAKDSSSSSTATTSGAGSNGEFKLLKLPSEILLEILSYFEPPLPLDTGEKVDNILYPNPDSEDTTTSTTAPAADTSTSDSDRDDDNDDGNSDFNDGGNGNPSTVAPAVTETYVYNEQHFLPRSSFARTDAFRALSQTCVAWRDFFWPMIWEDVELGSALRDGMGAWYKKLAQGLIRKAKGIIEDEEVAKRVQRIRVVVTRCEISTVLPTLASCLGACTNLTTINIYWAHSEITGQFEIAFIRLTLPSVQTVVLPTWAHPVLRSCPNVKRVVCNDGDASRLITAVKEKCKEVEVFEGIPWICREDWLVKRLPFFDTFD